MRRADELAVAPATAMTTAPPHSMHDDCGASDVGRIGPTAAQVELRYFQRKEGVLQMGGMCPGFGLDAEGHPLSITFTRKSAYVVRLHKDTLQPLNVHRIPQNGGATEVGLEKMTAWLGKGKWDVIHFNFGLHDAKYTSGTT